MTGRSSWAAAMICTAGIGLLIGGCGGGSTKPTADSLGATTSADAAQHAAPQGHGRGSPSAPKPRHHKRGTHRPGAHRAGAPGTAPSHPGTFPQVGRGVPAGKRSSIARGTAAITLKVFGFSSPAVSAAANGETVRATVGSTDACLSSPDAESKIAGRIRQILSYVRSVHITVAGTAQSLSAYVRGRCGGLGLPAGKGRVLLTQRGSYFETTKTFTVHSRRWTIEYVNGGKQLQIFPIKRGAPTTGAFTVSTHGPGQRTVSGAGTYSLRIGGLGNWAVRVRDGA